MVLASCNQGLIVYQTSISLVFNLDFGIGQPETNPCQSCDSKQIAEPLARMKTSHTFKISPIILHQ